MLSLLVSEFVQYPSNVLKLAGFKKSSILIYLIEQAGRKLPEKWIVSSSVPRFEKKVEANWALSTLKKILDHKFKCFVSKISPAFVFFFSCRVIFRIYFNFSIICAFPMTVLNICQERLICLRKNFLDAWSFELKNVFTFRSTQPDKTLINNIIKSSVGCLLDLIRQLKHKK